MKHPAGIYADMTVDGALIGTLVVVVDKAKNLPNRKSIGKQDPYCVLRLGKEVKKTEPDKRGGQTPRWDQELRFNVHDGADYRSLKLVIFHDDKKTELIGETLIGLDSILDSAGGGQADGWHQCKCRERYAGDVRVELTFWDSRPREVKPLLSAPRREVVGFEKKEEKKPEKLAGPRGPPGAQPDTFSGSFKKRPLPEQPSLLKNNSHEEEDLTEEEDDDNEEEQVEPVPAPRHKERERHRDRHHQSRSPDKARTREHREKEHDVTGERHAERDRHHSRHHSSNQRSSKNASREHLPRQGYDPSPTRYDPVPEHTHQYSLQNQSSQPLDFPPPLLQQAQYAGQPVLHDTNPMALQNRNSYAPPPAPYHAQLPHLNPAPMSLQGANGYDRPADTYHSGGLVHHDVSHMQGYNDVMMQNQQQQAYDLPYNRAPSHPNDHLQHQSPGNTQPYNSAPSHPIDHLQHQSLSNAQSYNPVPSNQFYQPQFGNDQSSQLPFQQINQGGSQLQLVSRFQDDAPPPPPPQHQQLVPSRGVGAQPRSQLTSVVPLNSLPVLPNLPSLSTNAQYTNPPPHMQQQTPSTAYYNQPSVPKNALVLAGDQQSFSDDNQQSAFRDLRSNSEPPPYNPYDSQEAPVESLTIEQQIRQTQQARLALSQQQHAIYADQQVSYPPAQNHEPTHALALRRVSQQIVPSGSYDAQYMPNDAPQPLSHSRTPSAAHTPIPEPELPNYDNAPPLPPPSPNTMQNEMHIPDFESHQLVHRRSFSPLPPAVPPQQARDRADSSPSRAQSRESSNRRRSVSPNPPLRGTLQERIAAQQAYVHPSQSYSSARGTSTSPSRKVSPLPPTQSQAARRRSVSPAPPHGQLALRDIPPLPPPNPRHSQIAYQPDLASEYSTVTDNSGFVDTPGSGSRGPIGAQSSSSPRATPEKSFHDPNKQPHVEDEEEETDSCTNSGMTSGGNSWSAQPGAQMKPHPLPSLETGANNTQGYSGHMAPEVHGFPAPIIKSRGTTPTPSRGPSRGPSPNPYNRTDNADDNFEPRPLERKLTVGIPFSPDCYEMINPVGTQEALATRSPGGNVATSPFTRTSGSIASGNSVMTKDEKKAIEKAQKAAQKLARKKIHTPGSKNSEPLKDDDILVEDSFAPEPEKRNSFSAYNAPEPEIRPLSFTPRRQSVSPQPQSFTQRRASASPQPGYSPYDSQSSYSSTPTHQQLRPARSSTSMSMASSNPSSYSSRLAMANASAGVRPLPGPPNAIMAPTQDDYAYQQDTYAQNNASYTQQPDPYQSVDPYQYPAVYGQNALPPKQRTPVPRGSMSQEDWALSQELSGISIGSSRRRH